MRSRFKIKNSKLKITAALLFIMGTGFFVISCKGNQNTGKSGEAAVYYTCPMHKFIHKDGPGKCPVCSMDLVPVNKEVGQAVQQESAALKGLAPVEINPFQEKMIDVKTTEVEKRTVTRLIRTAGKFAGGTGDFASLASDFIAQNGNPSSGPTGPSGQAPRPLISWYVIADIYALDQPFVKVGQKAWISALGGSGSKLEGVVAFLYPYDGTQSRVVRVRINLKQPAPMAIYANVEIEASAYARLAVPREAVLNTGTQSYVFVKESEGKFMPRNVETGFQGDQTTEILNGLKPGEKVAFGGVFMLDADAHMNATQE